MPRIETTLVDDCCGVGEIACVQPMACIANAASNTPDVYVTKLLVSPQNIFRALTERAKGVKFNPAPGAIRQSPLVESRSTN